MTSGDMLKRRYRLVRQIGSGTFATVYLAQDLASHEYYAVKVIDKKWFNDETMYERFTREVELGMQLRHNHIAKVLSYGRTEAGYYIVMEWIQGVTLRQYLQKKADLSVDEAISITQQVLSALAYAYHHGVTVHRDLKPENIMIEAKTGRVIVLDFGIAQIQGSNVTKHTRLFSLRYAAPEQLMDSKQIYQPSTDLYAVAVILYEMLTRRVPFKGRSMVELYEQEKKREFIPPHRLNPSLSNAWQRFFETALHPNPKERYQTPVLMNQDLIVFFSESIKKSTSSPRKSQSLTTAVFITVTSLLIITLLLFLPKFFKNNYSFKQLKELGKQIGQNVENARHRLTIQSEKEITVSILEKLNKVDITKEFVNDPNFAKNNKETGENPTQNKIFHILKIKKELDSEEKVPFDFEEGKEYTIQIQDINQYYYPIDITLRYQIGEDQKPYWEWVAIEGNRPVKGLDSIAILDNETKKILHIDEALFNPIVLLKIDAKEATKISLSVEGKSPFFEDPKFSNVTDVIKNDKTWSFLKSATEEIPVKVTLKLSYPGNQNDHREIMLQYCGEENNKQTWKVESVLNDLDVSLTNENFTLYPTLKIVKNNLPPKPLSKKGSVTFTIVDSSNQPVKGSLITFQGSVSYKKSSSDNGKVTFSNLPYGHYTVTVNHSQYEDKTITFTLNQPVYEHPPIVLTKKSVTTHEITFQVIAGNRKAIFGASIIIQGGNPAIRRTIYTDLNGISTIYKLTEGTYTYTISHPDFQTSKGNFSLPKNKYTKIEVELEPTTQPPPPKQGSVTFKIVDSVTNQPVKGALISIQGIPNKVTDNQGKATFSNLPYGAYAVTVKNSEYEEKTITFTLSQSIYEHPPIVLTKKQGSVTFTILNSDNQPVNGALISIQGGFKKVTLDNGKATFDSLPYGSLTFTVRHSHYEEITITFTLNQPVYEHPPIVLTKKVGTTSNTFSWFAKTFCHQEMSQ